MGVKQPLFGSGPITGTKTGTNVLFFVNSAIGQIEFTGRQGNNGITGTYTVRHEGYPDQEGNFTLTLVKAEGLSRPFDPRKCPTDAEVNQ
jgi:hypothetical protein